MKTQHIRSSRRTLNSLSRRSFVALCSIGWLSRKTKNDIQLHFVPNDTNNTRNLNEATTTKKATLCTVIKDQERRYIDEWADYHMMATGFTGLRLYDNTENFVLEDWGRDKPYAEQIERVHFLPGRTHNITHFEGVSSEVQSEAFMDCVHHAIEQNVDWVAGFDLDEFLVLRNYSSSILDFMDEYCKYPCGQLSFNWRLFGPSDRTKYVPVPDTKRFQTRIKSNDEAFVKGIADPKAVDQSSFWIHTFPLLPPRTWLDTNGKKIEAQSWQRWLRLMNQANPQNVAVLHHYKTLSEEEWNEKNCGQKHTINNNPRPCGKGTAAQHLPALNGMTFDDTAWRILAKHVPDYTRYNLLGIEDLG